MNRRYVMFAAAVLALFTIAQAAGWGLGGAGKGPVVPASVRQSPGGYRTFGYWRGGK